MLSPLYNLIEQLLWLIYHSLATLSPYKIYRNDPLTNFQLPRFVEFTKQAQFKVKLINSKTWRGEMNLKGEVRANFAYLERRFDPKQPTLIFHHGAGVVNYQPVIKQLFSASQLQPYNLISIRAQRHGSASEFIQEGFDSLLHQQATFAGSVLMVEELVKFCHKQGSKAVMVGTSMGGIVASWHYLLFNSADLYFPITAYPNVTEIFLGSGYWGMVDRRVKRSKLKVYQEAFRIAPLKPSQKVFPILGEKDPIVLYKPASRFWAGYQTLTFPLGHSVTRFRSKEITQLIAKQVDKIFYSS